MSDVSPNTCEALESAVMERLSLRLPDLAVEAYPDDPDNYRLDHPVGALLVRYHGSKYGPLLDPGLVVQERRLAIEVTLVMRSLNGKDGVYGALESVRQILTGYAPPAFGKLVPIGDEFLSEGGGEWRYAIDFMTTTMAIEEEEPQPIPLVTRITFKGEGRADISVPRAN